MKAIVLTYDKYRTITDHMIFKYDQLWPNHPFQFMVPFQELSPLMAHNNVDYIKTSRAIKSTIIELLRGMDDEEWIYWCIDDKYPIYLNVPRIESIFQWLLGKNGPKIDGILFCRARQMWNKEFLSGIEIIDNKRNKYLERRDYHQIWIHQFLRVKIIRHLFELFPNEISNAKTMDEIIMSIIKPMSHHMYVSMQNLAIYGESTSRGILTRNCYNSLVENGFNIPAWSKEIASYDIIIGKQENEISDSIK